MASSHVKAFLRGRGAHQLRKGRERQPRDRGEQESPQASCWEAYLLSFVKCYLCLKVRKRISLLHLVTWIPSLKLHFSSSMAFSSRSSPAPHPSFSSLFVVLLLPTLNILRLQNFTLTLALHLTSPLGDTIHSMVFNFCYRRPPNVCLCHVYLA